MDESSKNLGKKLPEKSLKKIMKNRVEYSKEDIRKMIEDNLESALRLSKNIEEKSPKQRVISPEGIPFESMKQMIGDAGTQFMRLDLGMFGKDKIEDIKNRIKNTDFKNLEEYTGRTREELNKEKPGVCEEYEAIIEGLKEIPKIEDNESALAKFKTLLDRNKNNIVKE